MKLLLFDQNLSPRLINLLADIYPASIHVDAIGLPNAPDREVWDYARQHDYIIVTKDADFSELSLLLGFPPKVIWIRRGNCSTRDIERLLRDNYDAIAALSDTPNSGIISLF
jgi:predicted nuclease of predicted toxin-antitoxin system